MTIRSLSGLSDRILLGAIVFLGAVVRFWGLSWGLPHTMLLYVAGRLSGAFPTLSAFKLQWRTAREMLASPGFPLEPNYALHEAMRLGQIPRHPRAPRVCDHR